LPFNPPVYASSPSLTITQINCEYEFGALLGSVWMVQMIIGFDNTSSNSAKDSNWVQLFVTDGAGRQGFFDNTINVNFSLSAVNISQTFMMYFGKSKNLIFKAFMVNAPPTNKVYTISSIDLLFTRIA
jgi:hypothetical protein